MEPLLIFQTVSEEKFSETGLPASILGNADGKKRAGGVRDPGHKTEKRGGM
jgi:hypothetical protein